MGAVFENRRKWFEFIRFCLVGGVASGLHYGIYYLLQPYMNLNIAYTTGYLISLVCNFFLTAYLTFRSIPTARKALGFGGSHLLNYLIHISLFNLLLYLGVSKELAPVFVLGVAIPTNFLILRWVFKFKKVKN